MSARNYTGGPESGHVWWLFPALPGTTDTQLLNLLEDSGSMRDRDGWCCHTHGGDCGRQFGRKAHIRRTNTRTLVTQYVGVDV